MSFLRHNFQFQITRASLVALVGLGVSWISPAHGRDVVRDDLRPAPSSPLTRQDALAIGALWKQSNPEKRDYCAVAPTGSMAPILDSRSVLLIERASADDLRKNDLSIYLASAVQSICHRVIEVRPYAVLFDGDNNRRSDGWIPAGRVRWRVAAIIFTRR